MSASKVLDLSSAALGYAKRGWPVFPLVAGGKEPRTSNGFKAATTDRDTVLAYWSQWPDSNIGLRTGVAFDVLDIDGPEGKQSLLDFLRDEDAKAFRHSGPVSITGKGHHLLFQLTGSRNGANLIPKVDFRGEGGYIVAPPSLHPLGHHYAWDPNRGATAPLPPAPPWLKKLLSGITRREPSNIPTAIVREHGPSGLSQVTLVRGDRTIERPDIFEVAAQMGLDLTTRSHYALAKCPFHADDTPSFALYPSRNDFHCFGCGAHGDSNDLLARRDMNGKTF